MKHPVEINVEYRGWCGAECRASRQDEDGSQLRTSPYLSVSMEQIVDHARRHVLWTHIRCAGMARVDLTDADGVTHLEYIYVGSDVPDHIPTGSVTAEHLRPYTPRIRDRDREIRGDHWH